MTVGAGTKLGRYEIRAPLAKLSAPASGSIDKEAQAVAQGMTRLSTPYATICD